MKRRDFLLSVPALLAAPALAATGAVVPWTTPATVPFDSFREFLDWANYCHPRLAKYTVDSRLRMVQFAAVPSQLSLIESHLYYIHPSIIGGYSTFPVVLDFFEFEGMSRAGAGRVIFDRVYDANDAMRSLVAETERRFR